MNIMRTSVENNDQHKKNNVNHDKHHKNINKTQIQFHPSGHIKARLVIQTTSSHKQTLTTSPFPPYLPPTHPHSTPGPLCARGFTHCHWRPCAWRPSVHPPISTLTGAENHISVSTFGNRSASTGTHGVAPTKHTGSSSIKQVPSQASCMFQGPGPGQR